jgi:hypothetical protein
MCSRDGSVGQAGDERCELVGGHHAAENPKLCDNEGNRLDYQTSNLGPTFICNKDKLFSSLVTSQRDFPGLNSSVLAGNRSGPPGQQHNVLGEEICYDVPESLEALLSDQRETGK